MNEQQALAKMIAPGQPRPSKWRQGVIQIVVTSSCDLSCYNCTQASNVSRKHWVMSPAHFEDACKSLRGYFGVVGVFGGNPAVSKHFEEYCEILRDHVPFEQRGLWCNHPLGKGAVMRQTFNPAYSNLNVHLSKEAFDEFKRDWPESRPCGLTADSRHSPGWVAMKDILVESDAVATESGLVSGESLDKRRLTDGEMWTLASGCDINQTWSAAIGVFRGELRAWFCEIAGAQAMLHQDEPDYPDTGTKILADGGCEVSNGNVTSTYHGRAWWRLPMFEFEDQVRKHCFDCGVPLRGRGENAMTADAVGVEQVSATHASVYKPKRKSRQVQVVTELVQLGSRLENMTRYIQNSVR